MVLVLMGICKNLREEWFKSVWGLGAIVAHPYLFTLSIKIYFPLSLLGEFLKQNHSPYDTFYEPEIDGYLLFFGVLKFLAVYSFELIFIALTYQGQCIILQQAEKGSSCLQMIDSRTAQFIFNPHFLSLCTLLLSH